MAPAYASHFLLFSHLLLLVLAAGYHQGECPPSFDCGHDLGNISFPFTVTQRQDCGLLIIHNCDDPVKPRTIQLQNNGNGKWFTVLRVYPSPSIPATTIIGVVRDNDLYDLLQAKSCEAFSQNYTLPPTFPFGSIHIDSTTTLFRCDRTLHVNPPKDMQNYTACSDYDFYYNKTTFISTRDDESSLTACTKVQLPIKDVPDADPFKFITSDFIIEVKLTDECTNCHYDRRGQCQLDNRERFDCAYALSENPDPQITAKKKKVSKVPMLIVATAASLAGVAILIVLACCFRTKIFPPTYFMFWKENQTHRVIKTLKEHGYLPTVKYNFSEVKKMTNSFRNKIGQGGFGCVYKGKLQDGRTVAVKVLTESKGNGKDFINEIASISRTSHVNIVRLLGFSLNGSKRALIYEFMPNGSLEKFIYEGKNTLKADFQMDCKTLYDIAVGVARGLEYLHRGCNTRILHFDIKPHNILLDEDFCPKISDFGVARICPRKESIISTFGARGTIGYIAPELCSRNFGAVSHKSDVYSYGMMVLEMVGQRTNANVAADCSTEMYFPHWIYKRLELNQELEPQYIKNEIDEKMVRKMTVVGLWCIQTNPSNRPAMSKVVEMLEGSLEALEIPPKPSLSSPSTSPAQLAFETSSL